MKTTVEFFEEERQERKFIEFCRICTIFGITIIFAVVIFLLFLPRIAKAQMIDLSIISKIESNNNPFAYNKHSKATGKFQITPVCLKEFNNLCNKRYTMQDMFNANKNKEVAQWYLNLRIPSMLKHYKKEVNIINIIRAYNCGIKSVVRNYTTKETKDYIKKYNQLSKG